MKAEIKQSNNNLPHKTQLTANIFYMIKQHQVHDKYLQVCLDKCADVNIMPKSVYQMIFNDPEVDDIFTDWFASGLYWTFHSQICLLS